MIEIISSDPNGSVVIKDTPPFIYEEKSSWWSKFLCRRLGHTNTFPKRDPAEIVHRCKRCRCVVSTQSYLSLQNGRHPHDHTIR